MIEFRKPCLALLTFLCSTGAPSAQAETGHPDTPTPDTPAAAASQASDATPATTAPQPSAATQATAATQDDSADKPTPKAMVQAGRAFIGHIPKNTAPVGDVILRFDVRGADLAGQIIVRYRQSDSPDAPVEEVRVLRWRGGHGVTLSLAKARPPGIAYWVVERMADGTERPVFASAGSPHPLALNYDAVRERGERALQRVEGRRSTLGFNGEVVSLGRWKLDSGDEPDADLFYRGEVQYAYRFYGVIDELRVGLGKLKADVFDARTGASPPVEDCDQGRRCIGLEYGLAETTFAASDVVRVRTGLLLGISEEGFAYGLAVGLILGPRERMELDIGGEFVSTVGEGGSHLMGATFAVHLGWNTIERLPMGAAVEITNFPTADAVGVWLKLDAGYEMYPGALLKLVGGYRGRTSLAGGPSLGTEVQFAF